MYVVITIYIAYLGIPGRRRREIIMANRPTNVNRNTPVNRTSTYGVENRRESMDVPTQARQLGSISNRNQLNSQTICLPTPPPPDTNIHRRYVDIEEDENLPNVQFTIPPESIYRPPLTPPSSSSSSLDFGVHQSQSLIPPTPPRRTQTSQRRATFPDSRCEALVRGTVNHSLRSENMPTSHQSQRVCSAVLRTGIPRRRCAPSATIVRDPTVSHYEREGSPVVRNVSGRRISGPPATTVREPTNENHEEGQSDLLQIPISQRTRPPSPVYGEKGHVDNWSNVPSHIIENDHSRRTFTPSGRTPPQSTGTVYDNNLHHHSPSTTDSGQGSQQCSQRSYSRAHIYDVIQPVASTSREYTDSHVVRDREHLKRKPYSQCERNDGCNDSSNEGRLGRTNEKDKPISNVPPQIDVGQLQNADRERFHQMITDVEMEMVEMRKRWEKKNQEKEDLQNRIAKNEKEIQEDMILQQEMMRRQEQESNNFIFWRNK